ncbi:MULTISPECIES: hypothetical protein [unclassified Streptomyces]|uniref:hypothetical protein n=1 Tax=unclassified Streptomyces TaxID=2593676 RepID=UPI001F03A5E3|nr:MULTISPECIES: hypothetical protein [unclassified Streptomyces]MCH0563047.1 hypothetical protein [Streptomyces sp. MUM 2J]MCH0570323.1 hypothetical protein [Streptomyces sp. MUM 136J]
MTGTVLLLAAAPAGRGRLVDAASVLPVLAAVPPAVLAGTDTANVVELADPLDPQAVLTRLRAAAAAPGPLTVYVTGQLHLDRRQRLPHLALARTTAATVRYTGFPWHWFRDELRLRPVGSTCLLLDLHSDAESWQWLRGGAVLDCGTGHAVHGRIAPPPGRRALGTPSYMRTAATVLRSGRRPPTAELHQQVLDRLGGETAGDLVLADPGGPPAPPAAPGTAGVPAAPDAPGAFGPPGPTGSGPRAFPEVPGPRPAPAAPEAHASLTAAVQAGRHADADALAARLEEEAVRAQGPGSGQALHWAEVRADLAMLAGDAARSCRSWLTVAAARLAAGQATDAPQVEAAVDRAHHQWSAVRDPARARELGLALAELRGRVPGRHRGALDHVRRQLRELQT